MEYGFSLNRHFDYVIDLSGSTYPIRTKQVNIFILNSIYFIIYLHFIYKVN